MSSIHSSPTHMNAREELPAPVALLQASLNQDAGGLIVALSKLSIKSAPNIPPSLPEQIPDRSTAPEAPLPPTVTTGATATASANPSDSEDMYRTLEKVNFITFNTKSPLCEQISTAANLTSEEIVKEFAFGGSFNDCKYIFSVELEAYKGAFSRNQRCWLDVKFGSELGQTACKGFIQVHTNPNDLEGTLRYSYCHDDLKDNEPKTKVYLNGTLSIEEPTDKVYTTQNL